MTTIGFDYYPEFSFDMKLSGFNSLQNLIKERFKENKPFFIARVSGAESREMGYSLENKIQMINRDTLRFHAGICIIDDEDWKEYVEMTMQAFRDCDYLAIWDAQCYLQCPELYQYIKREYPHLKTIPAHSLEPYHFMETPNYIFPTLFVNKKILIITSHANSVLHQLTHIHNIFSPYSLFPDPNNILVYKCTIQNGLNSDGYSWKGHYLKMCIDISKFDFDVAFIGCGGFSNILGHYIFNTLHKSALYIGGPIQLYFGILGNRWVTDSNITKWIHKNGNDWIRPLPQDTPSHPLAVEHGCYWLS